MNYIIYIVNTNGTRITVLHRPTTGLMLVHRLRRWLNSKQTSSVC